MRAAIKVKASVIICFTSSGRAARFVSDNKCINRYKCFMFPIYEMYDVNCFKICRLIAKYRPTMPVLSVVIPRLKTNQLRWTFTGAFEVKTNPILQLFFLFRVIYANSHCSLLDLTDLAPHTNFLLVWSLLLMFRYVNERPDPI